MRLSLATVAAIALDAECLEDAIRATHRDGELEALCRIAMQCQIIDDVLDYSTDLAAGLPSFLTASASLSACHGMDGQRGTVLWRDPRELVRYALRCRCGWRCARSPR